MNYKTSSGTYEILYPRTTTGNITDFSSVMRNYYTKGESDGRYATTSWVQNNYYTQSQVDNQINDQISIQFGKYLQVEPIKSETITIPNASIDSTALNNDKYIIRNQEVPSFNTNYKAYGMYVHFLSGEFTYKWHSTDIPTLQVYFMGYERTLGLGLGDQDTSVSFYNLGGYYIPATGEVGGSGNIIGYIQMYSGSDWQSIDLSSLDTFYGFFLSLGGSREQIYNIERAILQNIKVEYTIFGYDF